MKLPGAKVIALALTWDGARWPIRTLPPKARAFLAKPAPSAPVPSTRIMAELLRDDQVAELRICWVPRLKGGRDVLSDPFQTATGRRLGFKATRTVVIGDILGVVYRRSPPHSVRRTT
jgi:hypothetical protein